MFGAHKPQPPPSRGRINLPNLKDIPTKDVYQTMYEQARENQPRDVEQLFVAPNTNLTYSLGVKFDNGKHNPVWTLLEDDGTEAQMLWQQESGDFDLINDMVCMSAQSTRAMDRSKTGMPAIDPSAVLTQAPSYQQPSSGFAGGYGGATSGQSGAFNPADLQGQPAGASGGFNATASSGSLLQQPQAGGVDYLGDKMPSQSQHGPRFSDAGPQPETKAYEGSVESTQISTLLNTMSADGLTGRLEILGDESVGEIYLLNGTAMYAHVAGILGDNAVRELITWRKGSFAFFPDEKTEVRNVLKPLMETVMEGIALLDKKKHLERMGLTTDAYLVKKGRNLGDTEVRLMLSKGESISMDRQLEVFRIIGHKYSLNDLLRDRPMESAEWIPMIFNFLTCELIDIRPPDAVKVGALDFLGEGKTEVENILESMVRPETGVLSYPAFLLYLQHEFFRFEAYGWPLSIILFEMNRKKDHDTNQKRGDLQTMFDVLPPSAVQNAAQRIGMVKRPLDILGHYEMLEYALLLPNTRTASAAYVANRILQTLTVTPLIKNLDKKSLKLAFGVANLPADGDSVQQLLSAARNAKDRAVEANFPLIISKSYK
jgi:GGDEF domain-containing protein